MHRSHSHSSCFDPEDLTPIQIGIERLPHSDTLRRYQGARIGLLTHLAAVDRDLVPTLDRLAALPGLELCAIFTPEHGLYGVAQAGDLVADEIHPEYGIPIYSLYGARKEPTDEMLRDLDALFVDFQDVGVRFYTYLSALGYVLAAAATHSLPVIVLDRPNPLSGSRVEGPIVQEPFRSYVGRNPLPLRYGMTTGETARWIAASQHLPEPEVVTVAGWRRHQWFDELNRPWVPTSPNMPTFDTALVYPGMALLEGTNLSEGRGTTRPFETFGAPWLRAKELIHQFHRLNLPGVRLREAHFVPTFSKYRGELCHGAQLHITDREAFRPVETAGHLLQTIAFLHPQEFRFTDPVNGRRFFDLLCGTDELRTAITTQQDLTSVYKRWRAEAQQFYATQSSHFLYL
jgi:uncharacterized protein YbbC (DUF1343 family)